MNNIHSIVKQIIDRDCHVAMTGREVVRHVISKLRSGFQTFREMPKAGRRQLISDCLERHCMNWQLYLDVMSGRPAPVITRLDNDSTVARPDAIRTGQMSGQMLCRFMRQQRVTIRELSIRTGITQKRIRHLRNKGIQDPLVVRDFLQAIAGVDPGPIPKLPGIRSSS